MIPSSRLPPDDFRDDCEEAVSNGRHAIGGLLGRSLTNNELRWLLEDFAVVLDDLDQAVRKGNLEAMKEFFFEANSVGEAIADLLMEDD